MPLSAGDRLGPYEIIAPLGAGGMGEVYRAKDTKRKREVALKVLPDSFAADPERMARFQREAEVLASLNHTHIAQIYGVEERALAMELVEGEALQGPLAMETALDYARQIADGTRYEPRRPAARGIRSLQFPLDGSDAGRLADIATRQWHPGNLRFGHATAVGDFRRDRGWACGRVSMICSDRGAVMLRDYAERALGWLRGRKPPPSDPYSSVRQPVRRGPPSLAAGVALEEPAPLSSLNLFGALLKKASRQQ